MSSSTYPPTTIEVRPPGRVSSARPQGTRRKRSALAGASIGSALEALWANRLRSLLTVLGVIIGVGAVIAAVTLTQGESALINARLAGLGTNVLTVYPGSSNLGGVSTGAGALPTLTVADAQALAGLSHVANVSPVQSATGQVIYGNQNWSTSLSGVSTSYQTIENWQIAEGSWWSPTAEQANLPVAVVGQTVVDNTFALTGTDPIGQTFRLNNELYSVIGVLAPKGTQGGRDLDDVVYVPITTYLRSTGQTSVSQILVQSDSAGSLNQVQQDATTLLEQRHHILPGQSDDFLTRTSTQIIQTAQQSAASLAILLIGIAAISLVVGGIGIMNIMLVSVTERTREIGLRMAVGAKPSDIRNQFLVEALILSIIGGVIGILAGLLSGIILTLNFKYPIAINPFSIVLAFGVAAIVGIVFGLYPAVRASRLDPIVALRTE